MSVKHGIAAGMIGSTRLNLVHQRGLNRPKWCCWLLPVRDGWHVRHEVADAAQRHDVVGVVGVCREPRTKPIDGGLHDVPTPGQVLRSPDGLQQGTPRLRRAAMRRKVREELELGERQLNGPSRD